MTPAVSRAPDHAEAAGVSRMAALVGETIKRIDKRYASVPIGPTGISELDDLIGSLEPGLALVSASPLPMDATTLALQIVVRAAADGRSVMVVSNRLGRAVLSERLLALAAGIDGAKLLQGRLSELDWRRLGQAEATLSSDVALAGPALTVDDLERLAGRRAQEPAGPSLIVVDGVEPLLTSQPRRAAIQRLGQTVANSGQVWLFTTHISANATAHDGSDPTWCRGLGHGLGDVVVCLRRHSGHVLARVEHGHGWAGELRLHQHRRGGRYFGLVDGLNADDHVEPSAIWAASPQSDDQDAGVHE